MSTDPNEEAGQLDRIEVKVSEIHIQLTYMLDLFNDHEEKIRELQERYQELVSDPEQSEKRSRWRFGVPVNTIFSITAFIVAVTVFFS